MIQFYAIPGPNSTLPSQQHRVKDPSPNITMMIDSGSSHILVRFEHAHILKYITMSDIKKQPFAKLKSAKIGSELSPIGRGLLQIGPFCFPAFIFRDDELQDSLLRLNPLTKRGCSAIFTDQNFSLLHDLNKKPILHGSKTSLQNSWRVAIRQYHGYPKWDFSSPTGFYETPRLGRNLLGQKTYITSGPTGTILTITRNSKGVLFRKSKGALIRKSKGAFIRETNGV